MNRSRSVGSFNRSVIGPDAKYDKVSYRQKGTVAAGQVLKGSVATAYAKHTVASMPSKFETVVYKQNGENKGFGSKAIRFQVPEPEDPGPGAYTNKHIMNPFLRRSESHSKKGFGNGFLSKVDRFELFNYLEYQKPGPASYQPAANQTPNTKQSQSRPLSVFVSKTEKLGKNFLSIGKLNDFQNLRKFFHEDGPCSRARILPRPRKSRWDRGRSAAGSWKLVHVSL